MNLVSYFCNGIVKLESIKHFSLACPNGVVEGYESCDDNNSVDGDGCSADCLVEDYATCSGSPSVCTSNLLIMLNPLIFFRMW